MLITSNIIYVAERIRGGFSGRDKSNLEATWISQHLTSDSFERGLVPASLASVSP